MAYFTPLSTKEVCVCGTYRLCSVQALHTVDWPCCVYDPVLLQWIAHLSMHHAQWVTGQQHVIDDVWVEYYIDGETTPSIAFQPAFMCGLAFPSQVSQVPCCHLPKHIHSRTHAHMHTRDYERFMCNTALPLRVLFNHFEPNFSLNSDSTTRNDVLQV